MSPKVPRKNARSIPESLWRKSFLKSDGRYDGKKFENLAFDLLNALYGQGWKPTGITHDGSRDFEKCDGDTWMWAECKAYNDRLSVYVISPTLVMAVIEQPNTVIVVSRSVLNDNAFRHLAAFQNASGKQIIALDGPVLDNAILDMGLCTQYFPNLINLRPVLSGLLLHVSVTPDALREPTDLDFVPATSGMRRPITVVRYGFIRIDIALRNLSASTKCKTKIEIVNKTLDPSLRLISFGGLKGATSVSVSIPPAGIVRTSLVIQPREANELLRLPDIVATAPSTTDKVIKTGSVHVSHLYQIEIVGKSHKRILTHAGRFIKGRREPIVISIEGTSGSGKSRLMMEIAKIGIEEGFRCHFYNPEFEDAKAAENVIKDLIADISELPRLRNNQEEATFQRSSSSILVRALYDPTFVLWDHIPEVVNALTSILTRRPTVLIIDNLQFTDDRFAEFVDALIIQLTHLGSKRLALVLSINTDFMSPGGTVSELLVKLRARSQDELHRRTFFHAKLEEFGKDDVAEFVGAALSGQRTSDSAMRLYEKTLDVLIKKVEPKPLNLWQTLMYLADEGILSLQDDRLTVSGDELLASRLDTIPSRLGDLLELRWARIRKNEAANGLSQQKLERTVRAIYFLGSDTKDHLLKAGADKQAIERLLQVGILTNQTGGFIHFFHSQVFAFFRTRFLSLKKHTALTLRAVFQRLKLQNVKFQQYFIVCHFAAKVSGSLLVSSVRSMNATGLTVDYWRQYAELLHLYLTASNKSISATTLTGVMLIGEWQQRVDSLQSGQHTLRSFLANQLLTRSRNGLPGPALFEYYNATINACLAVYEDNEALEVITLALKDLRSSKFPNRKNRNASLGYVLNRKAATLKNFGRVEEALVAGFEALKRFEQIRDYSMIVETLFDLGSVSFGSSQQNAREYFERGCQIFRLHENSMREPAICRFFYVSGRLAIERGDFLTAFDICGHGSRHAEKVGRRFWGIRLVLLEAVARLLAAETKRDLQIVNELLIKARDWSNVSHAERSRTALSYLDGKLLTKEKDHARAADAFSEAVRSLAVRLITPEQVAWKSSLLIDIAATCRRYHLELDKTAISLLRNSGVRSQILEIQSMSDELFEDFERHRLNKAEFSHRGQIIELP